MQIEITYKESISQFPEAVQELKDKLESGTSKQKGTDPSEFHYSITWWQRAEGGSFLDMIKSSQKRSEKIEAMSDEELYDVDRRVSEVLPKIFSISLVASIGRWHSAISIAEDGDPPQIVIDWYRRGEEKAIDQEKKNAAMSEEEREEERQDLLGQLRGTPGFVEISVDHTKNDD